MVYSRWGLSFRGVPGDETEESGWQTREDDGEARVVGCEGAGLAVRGTGGNAVWPVDTRDLGPRFLQPSVHAI